MRFLIKPAYQFEISKWQLEIIQNCSKNHSFSLPFKIWIICRANKEIVEYFLIIYLKKLFPLNFQTSFWLTFECFQWRMQLSLGKQVQHIERTMAAKPNCILELHSDHIKPALITLKSSNLSPLRQVPYFSSDASISHPFCTEIGTITPLRAQFPLALNISRIYLPGLISAK